jgi:hypothetical protein
MITCWFLFRDRSAVDCNGVKLDKFFRKFDFNSLSCTCFKSFSHLVMPSSMTLHAGGGFQFLFFMLSCLMYSDPFSICFLPGSVLS